MPDEKAFQQRLSQMISTIRNEVEDPSKAAMLIQDLKNMSEKNPAEFVKTVQDFSDSRQIELYEQRDSTFNPTSAAIQGYAKTATFGLANKMGNAVSAAGKALFTDQSFSDAYSEGEERTRLLGKAYPGTTATSGVAGFVGPGLAGQTFLKGGSGALKVLDATSAAGLKAFGNKSFGSEVTKLLTQNYLTKGTAAATGGTVLYEGIQIGLDEAEAVARGKKTLKEAVADGQEKLGNSAMNGLTYGAAFTAGGLAAMKASQGVSRVASAGLKNVGKFAGKDLKYAVDNMELFQEVIDKTPQVVIAKSADEIAPVVQQYQKANQAAQVNTKRDLLSGIDSRSMKLEEGLEATSLNLYSAVQDLKNAAYKDVWASARRLQDEVGGAFREINAKYGSKIDPILESNVSPANLTRTLDVVEGELRRAGAVDASGRLLSRSQWAQTNPEAFAKLSDLWVKLGGPVRAQGGKAGVNVNLRDAVLLKQEIGAEANFARQANNHERIMRNVYNEIRSATEIAAPELREANKWYAANRSKLDQFRTNVGKNESNLWNTFNKNLSNNKFIRSKDAIEGLADVSEEAFAAAQDAWQKSDRLSILNTFRTKPEQAFTQVRQAYVLEDMAMMRQLDAIGERFPELRGYLATAKAQAKLMRELPKRGTVNQAFKSPEAMEELKDVLPYAEKAIANAQQTQRAAREVERVLPQDRLALEQQLASNQFGGSELQKQVVQEFQKQNPAAAAPLQNAEMARTVERIQTGKGIEKAGIEEIPFVGDALFQLRKTATRLGAKGLLMLAKANPKTRKALYSELLENLQGTKEMTKEGIKKLSREIGPEAAIVVYSQKGGSSDIQKAAEMVAGQFEEDDNPK